MDKRTADLLCCDALGCRVPDLEFDAVAARKASDVQIRSVTSDAVNVEGRRIRYVWSTETVDRAGDIVRQNWDLGPFSRNPISLWNHDHDKVLGRAHSFGVEFTDARRLVGDIEFAPEGADPFADAKFKLAAAGYLPATSVGFMPIEVDTVRDSERRAALGLGDYGVVFERNQLLEISVVSVPMNPEALREDLAEQVGRGIISTDEAEIVARCSSPTERDWSKRLERLRQLVPTARRSDDATCGCRKADRSADRDEDPARVLEVFAELAAQRVRSTR